MNAAHKHPIRHYLIPASILAWLLTLVIANNAHCQTATAEKPQQASKESKALGQEWVRLSHDKKNKPLALEVAIVRYVPADSTSLRKPNQWVDLVGAIHIADPVYYRQLNKRFRQYDAVLYELVAPEGTVVERGRGTSNANPLGAMQNGMKSMLELEHQLEKIDYTRPNFIHADLTPDEFMQSMENRNEGFLQLYFRMMGQAVAQQSQQAARGQSADLDIFSALVSKDRPRMLKIAMAKQFESMEAMIGGISGPDGSTLITVRNQRALDVLREQLDKGQKKLAIFYGAGHLSEMHKQMVEQFDMKPLNITWLEAWNLRE